MKRFKLLFLAAAIIGVGSAFTTVSDPEDEYVLTSSGYIQKADAIALEMGDCEVGTGPCTLILKEGHEPNGPSDFDPGTDVDREWVNF